MNAQDQKELLEWLKEPPRDGSFHLGGSWGKRQLYKAAREIESLTAERDQLLQNLETRDKFIVDAGLWPTFVGTLAYNNQKGR